jgi:uncharacterized protein
MTPRTLLAGVFRAYKRFASPLLPPACRFHPTCSEYAAQAIENHGALKGSALAAARLLRCNPWSAGGFDPVPSAAAPAHPPRA